MGSFHKSCATGSLCSPGMVSINAQLSSCDSRIINVTISIPKGLGSPDVDLNCLSVHEKKIIDIFRIDGSDDKYFLSLPTNPKIGDTLCVRGSFCRHKICSFKNTSHIYSNCSSDSVTTVATQNILTSNVPVVVSLVLVFLLAVIFIGFLMKKKVFANKLSHYKTKNISLDLLIVALEEHPKHREVILKFASFLKKDYGIRVHLDLYDKHKIYIDPTKWLEEKLSLCEKILIVWSPNAKKRWVEYERINERQDMFTPVLKHLKNDLILSKHLEKYIYVYFKYCDDAVVPKEFRSNRIPCFKLMDQFDKMCTSLSNSETTTCINMSHVTAKVNTPDLEISISEMMSLTQSNSNWFQGLRNDANFNSVSDP